MSIEQVLKNLDALEAKLDAALTAQPPLPEHEQALLDAIVGGTGVMFGDKRIDSASIYKQPEPVTEHQAVINAWSLREVYFDEDGNPSMHRSPPQRTWVGLTDEEVSRGSDHIPQQKKLAFYAGLYIAEKILKEKNT